MPSTSSQKIDSNSCRGEAANIAKNILSYMKENFVNPRNLKAIGCDGTNVNTGWKGGVIRTIEVQIGKPLQWVVCLLHANELPLRHLLQHFDGQTKGPNSFSGPIGLLLASCETKPIQKFESIDIVLPEVDKNSLSTDQRYLYQICCAIKNGFCSEALSKRDPGKINHARWLTTANRLLRLYVATTNPSQNFLLLVEFITKVYAPMWFNIKSRPSIEYGSIHLWQTINKSRHPPEEVKIIIDKVIHTNAYFAHPENILTAMIAGERSHIRELGFRRILKARTRDQPEKVRVFKIPAINWNAENYSELINWNECFLTEPPLTMDFKNEELLAAIRIIVS
uniref:Uncharacterized protein LOC114338834 n=1 Tax=Diabrotica virgifera virgifera TaxID=50390 RepID=A0A6P7GJ66_DIAVI